MVRPCSCPASDKLARAPRQGERHVQDTQYRKSADLRVRTDWEATMHTVVNQGCGCIWLVRRCLCSLQSTANEPYRNDISPLLYGDAVLLDEAERPLGKLRRRVLQLTDLRGCEGTRAYLQTCSQWQQLDLARSTAFRRWVSRIPRGPGDCCRGSGFGLACTLRPIAVALYRAADVLFETKGHQVFEPFEADRLHMRRLGFFSDKVFA